MIVNRAYNLGKERVGKLLYAKGKESSYFHNFRSVGQRNGMKRAGKTTGGKLLIRDEKRHFWARAKWES